MTFIVMKILTIKAHCTLDLSAFSILPFFYMNSVHTTDTYAKIVSIAVYSVQLKQKVIMSLFMCRNVWIISAQQAKLYAMTDVSHVP